jgi:hypothetical protein
LNKTLDRAIMPYQKLPPIMVNHMKRQLALALFATAIALTNASSQEIRVGHLEANDDSGINWVFFHCHQNGQLLNCDGFQTLIYHEVKPEQRANYVNKAMQDDPLKPYSDKQFCSGIAEAKRSTLEAIKTGKGADGRAVNPRQAQELLSSMSAMDDACRNPNLSTVRRALEALADQKIKTCKVLNDYSHTQFSWDQQSQSWKFSTDPNGPCGTVITGVLEHDKSSQAGFWLYTEKHVFTKRSGIMPNGLSCDKFSDSTLHYTWRAGLNFTECTYVENAMN